MQFDFAPLLVLLNTIALAFVAYYAKKNGNKKTPPTASSPSTDEIWAAINELQATQNSILKGVHKQLRATGRSLQVATDSEPLKPNKVGVIVRRNG